MLTSWKNRLLNKARRLALALSVLASIHSYYMQLYWLPQYTCDKIDQTTHNFVWKGTSDHGVHLVGRNKVAQLKSMGHLDLRMTRDTNVSLIGKSYWDFVLKSDKLWVNVLHSKYVGPNSFLIIYPQIPQFPCLKCMKARDTLKNGYSFRIGDDSSSFLTDLTLALFATTSLMWTFMTLTVLL